MEIVARRQHCKRQTEEGQTLSAKDPGIRQTDVGTGRGWHGAERTPDWSRIPDAEGNRVERDTEAGSNLADKRDDERKG